MMHFNHILKVLVVLFMTTTQVSGQNFGLTSPQDASTLPKSAVPIEKPVLKAKLKSVTHLETVRENEWKIADGWELAEASKVTASDQYMFHPKYNTSAWYNATVPGTVLTTLVQQGVYPEPYFGVNNLAIPDSLCRIDWWYRTSFKLPSGGDSKKVRLLFNGINYQAEIWLNGKRLGDIKGAFMRGDFDATALLNRNGDNILAVHILPPPNPGIPHEQSTASGRGPNGGQLCLDGPTFISSEGWDWVPGIRDRNIGLWQDVRIRYVGDVTLGDLKVVSDLPLPDTTSSKLTIQTDVFNSTSEAKTVTLKGRIGKILFQQSVPLMAGQKRQVTFSVDSFSQLNIRNPKLWWPNGYGAQALYTLEMSVSDDKNKLSDSKTTRFGIRELSYELTVDAPEKKDWRVEYYPVEALKEKKALFNNMDRRDVGEGVNVPKLREGVDPALFHEVQDKRTAPFLVLKVNGQRIFCKGGSWGMDDAMKQVTRQHLEPYFKLHQDAHFNMIRNWTGESTEEVFYELSDEYGMLVWNDFWLSTEGYNLNVNDDNLFLDNAREVIRRFVNHPSIAIWCARNEGYAPANIEENLAKIIAEEDGTRHYQPNSRYMNLRTSGPWHYYTDAADYFRNNAYGFNTELGTPSVPTALSMRKMMAKEDVWPVSDVWNYHDLHFGQLEYRKAIETLYGTPTSLEDFCKKAQMVNFDSHRAMFEAWNSKLWNNTSGLLLWMTHPAWPSMDWQVYSWDYETFGSYFGSLKGCEPIHVQMNLSDNKVSVVNTSLTAYKDVKVTLTCYDLQGKVVFSTTKNLKTILANQLTECFTPDFTQLTGVYLARVSLTDKKGRALSLNDYWKSSSKNGNFHAFNELPYIDLKVNVLRKQTGVQNTIEFEVTNTTPSMGVVIKLNLRNVKTSELVLPAYFTDGYFNLLPGESKKLSVSYQGSESVLISTDGYNIVNQFEKK